MNKDDLLRSEKGAALMVALLAIVIFSILGVTLGSLVSAETSAMKQTKVHLQARYLAEAGVERAIFEIKTSLQNGNTTSGSTSGLRAYDFTAGFPGGNVIANPPANHDSVHGVLNSLIPPAPVSLSYLQTMTVSDSSWYPAYDPSTTTADTFSWTTSGSTTTFNIKGHFMWSYLNTTAEDTIIHWSVGATGGQYPTLPSSTPDSITVYRTIVGVGQVSDNEVWTTSKIKVRACFSFIPGLTPDSPVIVNLLQWEDMYNWP